MIKRPRQIRPWMFLTAAMTLAWSARALALPAFPGAEGFGAVATGGRGGKVIKVRTLQANGPGSLQEALDAPGPRTIVFAVSGVIDGTIRIPHGDVTVAGQTAPGAGITLHGRLYLYSNYDDGADNVIIRHLRIRPPRPTGDISQFDAIQGGQNTTKLILDHVSVNGGADETVDLYTSDQVTVQWSTIEESAQANHPDGHPHNYGFIQGPDEGGRLSFHHNLITGNMARSPAIANGPADVVNNVVYNVRHGFIHHNPASGTFNIVGNTFKQGPNDSLIPFYFDGGKKGQYCLRDNMIDDPGEFSGAVDDISGIGYFAGSLVGQLKGRVQTTSFDYSALEGYAPISTQPNAEAYEAVLNKAGGFPRDATTTRVAGETRARTGSWGAKYPANLLDGLTAAMPPVDADDDGIADEWERAHGLDPAQPGDNVRPMPSGYTAVEEYINSLADALIK
jgi:pectate lyase